MYTLGRIFLAIYNGVKGAGIMNLVDVKESDLEIYNLVSKELERQRNGIELIASENFTSKAVMEVVGSCLTNKYAEGYPSKRYYGGCEVVDVIEDLARNRAIELFKAEGYHANVQPHSGSQANMAVYMSILNPGDTVMGMNLTEGGHLTHGSPVNFSGKLYNFIPYGVNKSTELIDYDELDTLAKKNKPKLIVAGTSAYARVIDFKRIKEICDDVGAYFMVDMAHIAGLVAAGLHPSPISYADFITSTTHKTLRGPRGGLILCKDEYAKVLDKTVFPGMQGGPLLHVIAGKAVCFKEAMSEDYRLYMKNVVENCSTLCDSLKNLGFRIVSGGTDGHLLLVDLTDKNISGKEAEHRLNHIGITVNKNTIPNEKKSPFVTSGIRMGTAAVTTRGFNKEDMVKIADIINDTLCNDNVDEDQLKLRVRELSNNHPLY